MRKIPALHLIFVMLVLSGCGEITLGPRTEKETIWAKMGTPCRITEDRKIAVLVPDGVDEKNNPKWKASSANLSGMVALDEPTLQYYRELDAKFGKGPSVGEVSIPRTRQQRGAALSHNPDVPRYTGPDSRDCISSQPVKGCGA